jgi:hypothetical protein
MVLEKASQAANITRKRSLRFHGRPHVAPGARQAGKRAGDAFAVNLDFNHARTYSEHEVWRQNPPGNPQELPLPR